MKPNPYLTDGVAYAADQLLLQFCLGDGHAGLEHHQPHRNLPLEIVVARDDRSFRHCGMGGDHQASNAKINVLR